MIPKLQRKVLLRELAATTCGAQLTCDSASMEPTIVIGEIVRIHSVSSNELRSGDVVVLESGDTYILHRIACTLPGGWFLHIGDAATAHGPRRAHLSSVVGRSAHPRSSQPVRVYYQLFRNLGRALMQRVRRAPSS